MPEFRQHPRTQVRERVWLSADDLTLLVPLKDISLGGLRVRSAALDVGSTLRVSFDPYPEDQSDSVELEAEVVWRHDVHGSGLRVVSFVHGATTYEQYVASKLV